MESLAEVWKPVVGLEGTHEVSNLGQVRSLDRMLTRISTKPFLRRGKILKGNNRGGQGYRTVNIDGGARYVHHLVLEAFIGPRPDRHEGCHSNGNRLDNRAENLRWGTPQSNQMDRAVHGTSNRGEQCANVKLTEEQARKILASNEPGCELARRYGVAQQTICNLRKGRSWAHLRESST